ncbi:hypothetical protein J5N97_030025 [Dioscorea zingiberensis]|uniref:Uncharacterized protein n=1 Tax=Dioscorea zingiberensis TaxID=325984 RepID=A0A9D5BWD3_9LILI|nr:hypothetical protein J5N97_030025 [Dioscorea zingiberensis]
MDSSVRREDTSTFLFRLEGSPSFFEIPSVFFSFFLPCLEGCLKTQTGDKSTRAYRLDSSPSQSSLAHRVRIATSRPSPWEAQELLGVDPLHKYLGELDDGLGDGKKNLLK